MAGQPHDSGPHRALKELILTLTEGRRSICPSEVARAAAEDWRPLMDDVRAAAAELAEEGKIVVTQRGKVVDVRTARGPVRLAPAQTPDKRS